ncbi:hypothetical protein ACFCYX_40115 [Streptomyces populi]|uniref:hypothetical protein n=1 Tax=Streptomyces populi TaxID=2058924 RepID=UPI0013A6E43C|nr:hypothetical protein [Streptomyces populi]
MRASAHRPHSRTGSGPQVICDLAVRADIDNTGHLESWKGLACRVKEVTIADVRPGHVAWSHVRPGGEVSVRREDAHGDRQVYVSAFDRVDLADVVYHRFG